MQSNQSKNKKLKVLLAATGSVASIKVVQLGKMLMERVEVRVVMTQSSKLFIDESELKKLNIEFYDDNDEKSYWHKRGDPVLHIQLRKWADAVVIAPLSANTLAKIVNGLSDNLVSLVCRCWDMTLKKKQEIKEGQWNKKEEEMKGIKLVRPLLVCPAMNTMMWDHPITKQHLDKLKTWGVTVVDPIQKILMCGESGNGAMANLETICQTLYNELSLDQTTQNTTAIKEK